MLDLQEGFRDLTTRFIFPDVARVGSEDAAMAEAVKDVSGLGRGSGL
jgi:hypothetical protein